MFEYKDGDVIEYLGKSFHLTKGKQYKIQYDCGVLSMLDDVGDYRDIQCHLDRIKLIERDGKPYPQSKFKVGDRVRCIRDTPKTIDLEERDIQSMTNLKKGEVFKLVKGYGGSFKIDSVSIDAGPRRLGVWSYPCDAFELVEDQEAAKQIHMTLDNINEELKSIKRQSDDLVKRERTLHEIRNIIDLGYRVTAPEKSP